MQKSPGQLAYEQDAQNTPRYPDGAPRRTWEQLSPIARDTWERNPTPRGSTLQKAPNDEL